MPIPLQLTVPWASPRGRPGQRAALAGLDHNRSSWVPPPRCRQGPAGRRAPARGRRRQALAGAGHGQRRPRSHGPERGDGAATGAARGGRGAPGPQAPQPEEPGTPQPAHPVTARGVRLGPGDRPHAPGSLSSSNQPLFIFPRAAPRRHVRPPPPAPAPPPPPSRHLGATPAQARGAGIVCACARAGGRGFRTGREISLGERGADGVGIDVALRGLFEPLPPEVAGL